MPSLSSYHLHLVQEAQRALLSLDGADTFDAWAEPAFAALRRLFGVDSIYYCAPTLSPCTERDAAAAPGRVADDGYVVCCPSAGDAFEAAIREHFAGFEGGSTCFRDPYSTFLHSAVRMLGPGAYHDGPFHDPEEKKRSVIYGEIHGAQRIERQIALSVPLPIGEAMLVAGFDDGNAPDFGSARHYALELLLPAFEAGLGLRLRAAGAAQREAAALDTLADAALAFDADGRERYRNAAFERLVAAEPEAARLVQGAHALRDLLTAPRTNGPVAPQRTLALASGTYRLRGCYDTVTLGVPGLLVLVERMTVLPPPLRLREQFGLTAREAEVALLLAEGRADKEIAEALFISPHTARRHTERVLHKMGVSSRAAVAHACIAASSGRRQP